MNMSVHPLVAPPAVKSPPAAAETTATRHLRGYELPLYLSRRYQLGQELGSGGFGFVVSAVDRATGHERAIKFIFRNKVPETCLLRDNHGNSWPVEIYVLKHACHDNIIGYIDSFADKTYYYLVMELHGSQWTRTPVTAAPTFETAPAAAAAAANAADNANAAPQTHLHQHLPGLSHSSDPSDDDDDDDDTRSTAQLVISRRGSCDLFECIEQHRYFDEKIAKHIFFQIVSSVAYLDKLGVCHRDIKDENIVIDANYKVKLIDFGSSVVLPRHFDASHTKPVMHTRFYGTVAFASPEILQRQPYQAEPAEVWALGVLLYTLVFGEVPFTNPTAALQGQIRAPINNNGVSPKCIHLIACLLTKNPADRPNIHSILTHPWLLN